MALFKVHPGYPRTSECQQHKSASSEQAMPMHAKSIRGLVLVLVLIVWIASDAPQLMWTVDPTPKHGARITE
jgi:hypothetical protein